MDERNDEGVISAEVFGELGPDGLGAPAALADFAFHALADLVGLWRGPPIG